MGLAEREEDILEDVLFASLFVRNLCSAAIELLVDLELAVELRESFP